MKRQAIADRTDELKLFHSMLAGKTDIRILLIQAASGQGKTDLLRRFAQECTDDTCLIRLDLKGVEKGIAQVLGVFRDKLSPQAFPRFYTALARLDPTINISDNKTIGKLDIAVVLNVDEQTRKIRLEMLEEAFFEDLRNACNAPVIVIFDTFEKAPPDLQNWLGSSFLSHIVRIPYIRVIIGGQRVPERTMEEWEEVCDRHELRDIENVDAWHTFVQEMQMPFPRDAVKAIVLQNKGHPKTIIETFAALAPQWGRA